MSGYPPTTQAAPDLLLPLMLKQLGVCLNRLGTWSTQTRRMNTLSLPGEPFIGLPLVLKLATCVILVTKLLRHILHSLYKVPLTQQSQRL